MIRPGQGLIQRKVLFYHHGAQRGGGNVRLNARRVVGIAHRQAELLAQILHGKQVRVLDGRGVLGVAVQKCNRPCAAVLQNRKRVLYLAEHAHAGGEDNGLFCGRYLFQIRQVCNLAAGHLPQRRAQLLQKIDASVSYTQLRGAARYSFEKDKETIALIERIEQA